MFTAPYSRLCRAAEDAPPHLHFQADDAFAFVASHGLAVRALGVTTDNAAAAHAAAVAGGGRSVAGPLDLGGGCGLAEVQLYGDVVLRLISGCSAAPAGFLPGYVAVDAPERCFGLTRLDHAARRPPKQSRLARRAGARLPSVSTHPAL